MRTTWVDWVVLGVMVAGAVGLTMCGGCALGWGEGTTDEDGPPPVATAETLTAASGDLKGQSEALIETAAALDRDARMPEKVQAHAGTVRHVGAWLLASSLHIGKVAQDVLALEEAAEATAETIQDLKDQVADLTEEAEGWGKGMTQIALGAGFLLFVSGIGAVWFGAKKMGGFGIAAGLGLAGMASTWLRHHRTITTVGLIFFLALMAGAAFWLIWKYRKALKGETDSTEATLEAVPGIVDRSLAPAVESNPSLASAVALLKQNMQAAIKKAHKTQQDEEGTHALVQMVRGKK